MRSWSNLPRFVIFWRLTIPEHINHHQFYPHFIGFSIYSSITNNISNTKNHFLWVFLCFSADPSILSHQWIHWSQQTRLDQGMVWPGLWGVPYFFMKINGRLWFSFWFYMCIKYLVIFIIIICGYYWWLCKWMKQTYIYIWFYSVSNGWNKIMKPSINVNHIMNETN